MTNKVPKNWLRIVGELEKDQHEAVDELIKYMKAQWDLEHKRSEFGTNTFSVLYSCLNEKIKSKRKWMGFKDAKEYNQNG